MTAYIDGLVLRDCGRDVPPEYQSHDANIVWFANLVSAGERGALRSRGTNLLTEQELDEMQDRIEGAFASARYSVRCIAREDAYGATAFLLDGAISEKAVKVINEHIRHAIGKGGEFAVKDGRTAVVIGKLK